MCRNTVIAKKKVCLELILAVVSTAPRLNFKKLLFWIDISAITKLCVEVKGSL